MKLLKRFSNSCINTKELSLQCIKTFCKPTNYFLALQQKFLFFVKFIVAVFNQVFHCWLSLKCSSFMEIDDCVLNLIL